MNYKYGFIKFAPIFLSELIGCVGLTERLSKGRRVGEGKGTEGKGIDADRFRNVSKERFVPVDCSCLRSQLQVRKGSARRFENEATIS